MAGNHGGGDWNQDRRVFSAMYSVAKHFSSFISVPEAHRRAIRRIYRICRFFGFIYNNMHTSITASCCYWTHRSSSYHLSIE